MLRRLRIAISVFCVVACVALVWLWFRSYDTADRLHGRFWGRQSFLLASKEGRVTVICFRWHGAPNWWQWEKWSFPVDDELAFPAGPVRQYESRWGFGWIRNPIYMVMRSRQTMPDGTQLMIAGAATATLRGAGPIVPNWFLVLMCGAVFGLARERFWRFGMRDLLIATTFLAILLCLVVTLDR